MQALPADVSRCADAEYHQCTQRDACARWVLRELPNPDQWRYVTWSNFATNRTLRHCGAFIQTDSAVNLDSK